jgi:hypothetical protein
MLTFNGLHSIISQKIELFITTAVRILNPTKSYPQKQSQLFQKNFGFKSKSGRKREDDEGEN